MLRVTCSACGQTYFGRPVEASAGNCELCGAVGTVTEVREAAADPPVATETVRTPRRSAPSGGNGAAAVLGVALVVVGVMIWTLTDENPVSSVPWSAPVNPSEPSEAQAGAGVNQTDPSPAPGVPDEGPVQTAATQAVAAKQASTQAATTQPETTRPAAVAYPFRVPETIPASWQELVALTDEQIPPFDDRGRPGAPTGQLADFMEMMRGYMKLPEDEQIAFLQWVATTHESGDLRIWACTLLADMDHKAELRGVLQRQDEERTRRFIERALARTQAKRMLVRPGGKPSGGKQ